MGARVLRLGLVAVCVDADGNGRRGVGIATVVDVGVFAGAVPAVGVAVGGVGVEDAGGVDEATGVVRDALAIAAVGVGVVALVSKVLSLPLLLAWALALSSELQLSLLVMVRAV